MLAKLLVTSSYKQCLTNSYNIHVSNDINVTFDHYERLRVC